MNKVLLASTVVVLIGACATPAERRANYIADAQRVCIAAGVPSEGPAFAECTVRIYQQQQEARDDAERPLVLRALKMMQPVMMAAIKAAFPPPAPPLLCTTRSTDGQSVTTCQSPAVEDSESRRPKTNE